MRVRGLHFYGRGNMALYKELRRFDLREWLKAFRPVAHALPDN